MLNPLLILILPQTTWGKIASAQRSVLVILLFSMVPLLGLSAGLEMYGLEHWGTLRQDLEQVIRVDHDRAVRYGMAQELAGWTVLIVGSWLIHATARSFHIYPAYRECFTVWAYGLSPHFLFRMVDAYPAAPTWGCWAMGVLGCAYTFYNGVALVLKPEPTKGFGMYLITVLLAALLTGLGHLLALSIIGRVF